MIAYFTLLGTTMSIIQQCHDYVHWEEIVIEQFELVSSLPDSPELATAQGSQGLDLVLFYIREHIRSRCLCYIALTSSRILHLQRERALRIVLVGLLSMNYPSQC